MQNRVCVNTQREEFLETNYIKSPLIANFWISKKSEIPTIRETKKGSFLKSEGQDFAIK